MNIEEIRRTVQAYLNIFPEERAGLAPLLDHIKTADETILTRKNFVGHITAAGFVVARDSREVLLVKHGVLGRYLQPGGHLEPCDVNFLEAAKREVAEETAITNYEYVPLSAAQLLVPIDIGVHFIPANPAKKEGDHLHYDFRYLFATGSKPGVRINGAESAHFKWTGLDKLAGVEASFVRASRKIDELL